MKLLLKEFQEDAVTRLVRHLWGAAREARAGDRQAVCLSSPTGSGKTVMLTRAVEVLLEGDDASAPIPDATFLWITDQPELNEQTRRKMLATSSVFTGETLIVLDASFNGETPRPGAVHFLNTQKLGKDKGLVSRADRRTYSIWEIVKNTIGARAGKFFHHAAAVRRRVWGHGDAEHVQRPELAVRNAQGQAQVAGPHVVPGKLPPVDAGRIPPEDGQPSFEHACARRRPWPSTSSTKRPT